MNAAMRASDGSRKRSPSAPEGAPLPPRPSPLVQLTLSRFREFFREPEAVFWTFLFPILMAGGLGIAFRARPADAVPIAVLSGRPQSERLQRALAADARVTVTAMDDSAAARALQIGRVALVVAPRDSAGAEYRFDPTRADARAARLVVDAVLQPALGRRDVLSITETLVTEKGSRYIDFVIPGLLAMNLMGSGIWGTVFAIVDSRRKKLLKRLVATPMSRAQYLLSFLIMRLFLMVAEVAAVTLFGVLVFGVPMRGSLLLFGATCLLGILTFGSIGLLLSSRARTVEAASGLTNLVMFPMWVGSGVFFSAANFPAAVQPFVQMLPLTAIVDALRGIMLRGEGAAALGHEWAIAATWMVVAFVLALSLFRWK